jgi:hypothetical protein
MAGLHEVAVVGDVDGDGVNDVAVGSPSDSDGGAAGSFRGSMTIQFMNADGTVRNFEKTSSTQGGFPGTIGDQDLFGYSFAPLGDLDGDGIPDLAIGARQSTGGGKIWIALLDPDGTVRQATEILRSAVAPSGTRFGSALESVGDLDGDGTVDLAVGMATTGPPGGRLWILFLNPDGTLKDSQEIATGIGGLEGTIGPNGEFGSALAALGDLGGDGTLELAVGQRVADVGGTDRGAVWILSLASDGTVVREQKISDLDGGFDGVLADFDGFGGALADIGDVDGDGVTDLAVGARSTISPGGGGGTPAP